MSWLKTNWRWVGLNLVAGAVLSILLSQGSPDWSAADAFDPGLESGKWAIRFLLICLAMTPLRTYLGWNSALELRKPAGLWSFGFAVLHVLFYIREAQWAWLAWPMPLYLTLGLGGLLILTALALTSNRWSMRHLKKSWKRLHRLVYLAGPTVLFHAMLATTASKKILVRDPQAIHELKVSLALLVVLLIVRLPVARRLRKQIPLRLQRQRQTELEIEITPVIVPDRPPDYRPPVNGHETGIPAADVLAATPAGDKVKQKFY
jgi:sulfoxide reductase heme-binding subunit YedZ